MTMPSLSRSQIRERSWPILLDTMVFCAVLAMFYAMVAVGRYWIGAITPAAEISRSPSSLPLYAFYSLVRMGVAYVASLVFAISYGYVAAYNKRLQGIMLAALDILQSIPVLSFLPGVMLAMVSLFPTRQIGIELGSIILIFTGQVWNMAVSFLCVAQGHSTRVSGGIADLPVRAPATLPATGAPYGAIGLVWNSMVSVAGGWFFLMACEMFVLGKRDFRLPGLGSYLQSAAGNGDTRAILWGLATMIAVIVLIDQLLWRPAIAWSDRYKFRAGGELLCSNLRRAECVAPIAAPQPPSAIYLDPSNGTPLYSSSPAASGGSGFTGASSLLRLDCSGDYRGLINRLCSAGSFLFSSLRHCGRAINNDRKCRRDFSACHSGLGHCFGVGDPRGSGDRPPSAFGQNRAAARSGGRFSSCDRVVASRPSRFDQCGRRAWHRLDSPDASKNQWYILFNVIAGAMAIPSDLREVAGVFRFSTLERWKTVILPGIFPYLITGLVTASGGAWNASIIAEYFHLKGEVLSTVGLGAQISAATDSGNFALLLLSTTVMATLVVTVNRLVWRPLYRLGETRFRLEN